MFAVSLHDYVTGAVLFVIGAAGTVLDIRRDRRRSAERREWLDLHGCDR